MSQLWPTADEKICSAASAFVFSLCRCHRNLSIGCGNVDCWKYQSSKVTLRAFPSWSVERTFTVKNLQFAICKMLIEVLTVTFSVLFSCLQFIYSLEKKFRDESIRFKTDFSFFRISHDMRSFIPDHLVPCLIRVTADRWWTSNGFEPLYKKTNF